MSALTTPVGGIAASLGQPLLLIATGYLALLLILNYGISATTFGPLPLHHAILGLALLGSLPFLRWVPLPLLLAPLLLAVAMLRVLAGDVGFWALRDAAQVIDMQWVLVGWALVAAGIHHRLRRVVISVITLAACYWLTFPVRDVLLELGPKMGLHGSGFLGYYANQFMAGFTVIVLLLWSQWIRPLHLVVLCAMLVTFTLMSMSRLTLGATIASLAYLVVVGRLPVWILIAGALSALLGIVVIQLAGIEIETRYGTLDTALLYHAALSVVGRGDNHGAAAGLFQRLDWWWAGIQGTLGHPMGWLWGQGFGVVLTDHGSAGDVVTRELHNSWLSAFCRLGLIGLGGLISLFGYLVWQLLRQRDRWRHVGVVATCFVLALTMFEPGFENPYAAALIWTGLGGACAHLALRRRVVDAVPQRIVRPTTVATASGSAGTAMVARRAEPDPDDLPLVLLLDGEDEVWMTPSAMAFEGWDDDLPIVVLDPEDPALVGPVRDPIDADLPIVVLDG